MDSAKVNLQGFVQSSLSKGLPKSELRKLLLDSGWDKNTVDSHIKKKYPEIEESKNAIVKFKSISKSFGKDKILDDVNLEIKKNEIFGIIGLSGSGKTTLLNILIGFTEPDSGDVILKINDKNLSVFKHEHIVKKLMGFATQSPSFYNDLTVVENLHHFASLYEIPKKSRIANSTKLMKLVGLFAHRNSKSGVLSGGLQKRLDIACALMHNPSILILDEPTADLDPIMRNQMWSLIRNINKKGTTVIIASHFLMDIEELCSRIGILRNGKISEVGSPDELRIIYSKNHEIHLETTKQDYTFYSNSALAQKSLGVTKTKREKGRLVLYTAQPEQTLHYLLHLIEQKQDSLIKVDVTRPTIQEVFEHMFKDRASNQDK